MSDRSSKAVFTRSPSSSSGFMSEPARQIPIVDEVDVVVVGGSCTGLFAAVRAARLGMKVAVIEKHNCFGGVATAGAVNIWHSLYDTINEKQIIAGLTLEVIKRLEKRNAVKITSSATSAYQLNTEELKIELDELAMEHDIHPYLHTLYVAPIVEEGKLRAVVIENKNGRQTIVGRQFIDATGDAALALDLGLDSYVPDDLQPPTLCAKIAGFRTLGDYDWQKAMHEHGAEFDLTPLWGWGCAIPGFDDLHMRADTRILGVDTAEARQLSMAEIEGRRQLRAIMDIIRKYGPPGSQIGLADIAATIGARETRRITAGYRITEADVLNGHRFDDAIANGSYRVDVHHANDPGITFRYLDGTEVVVPGRGITPLKKRWRPEQEQDPTFYQIPLRSLISDGMPNMILAGRMLDADKVAFSAVRVMVNMNQTGEAAGTACALAQRNGCDVTDVTAAEVRSTLAEGGSIII